MRKSCRYEERPLLLQFRLNKVVFPNSTVGAKDRGEEHDAKKQLDTVSSQRKRHRLE